MNEQSKVNIHVETTTETQASVTKEPAAPTAEKKRNPTRFTVKKERETIIHIAQDPVDGVERALSHDEAMKQVFIELAESKTTRKLLTGRIRGMDDHRNLNSTCLYVDYKGVKCIIPFKELTYFNYNDETAVRNFMKSMIGGEIDFVVLEVDEASKVAACSRKVALDIKKNFYLKKQINGKYIVNDGDTIEARVVAVGRLNAIIEALGVEQKLPAPKMSYGRIFDMRNYITNGKRILVKVNSINREDGSVDFNHKLTKPDPYDTCSARYPKGSNVMGTVVAIEPLGVFVRLEEGLDALCNHPGWTNLKLTIGDEVSILIMQSNPERKRVGGNIIRLIRSAFQS